MARPLEELQTVLKALDGVQDAYIQAPKGTTLVYPCIKVDPSAPNRYAYADNKKYVYQRGYSVIVVDRDPLSLIPAQVEELPHVEFDRFYRVEGLNHFVFRMYF